MVSVLVVENWKGVRPSHPCSGASLGFYCPDVTDSVDWVSGQNFQEQPEVLQSVRGPNPTCGRQLWVKTQQDKSHRLPHRGGQIQP